MTTIYRAATTDEMFIGSHWTDCADEAVEYTRNSGFGGPTVHTAELCGSVLRVDDTVELASAIIGMGFSMDHPWIDDFVLSAKEIAAEWAAAGLVDVFHVLENTEVLEDFIAESGYDWIRFGEPSITGAGASTTYRRLS